MRLEYQILLAIALDLVVGDPRWLPHPVRGIGLWATAVEKATRRAIPNLRLAGIVAEIVIVGAAAGAAWGLIRLCALGSPLAADIAGIVILYTAIAARDLAAHSQSVHWALRRGDLELARKRVAMIVGRDTSALDAAGISRAAIESVAESTVDGVTAPIFFAILFGPVGALAYRAINTLDSMFGYKDDRYFYFGWAAARLDDLANYIPARITGPLMALAAAMLWRRPLNSLRVLARDARKHESPNAGFPEAAMAGALGVQLGGRNYYNGEPLDKPAIGDALCDIQPRHIAWANALMLTTMVLFTAAGIAIRWGVVELVRRQ